MALLVVLYVMMFSNFFFLPHTFDRVLVVAAVSFVAVGWCLRWPVPVALIIVACFGFSLLAGGPAVVAAVAVAMRRRPWEIVGVGVLWVAVAARLVLRGSYYLGVGRNNGWSLLASTLVLLVVIAYGACVVAGWYIGSRGARIASLQARAEAIEREQAERIEKARTAERTRIAREMHDVLAHRISLVAIHSGALAYRTDLTPEQVRVAATTVQESAHLALAELREVLGILRDTSVEPGSPDRPQPTLATLDDLLAETREAGTPVTLTADAATADLLPTLGASTSRHAYRILQEALTNARKHAPGAAVEVKITGTPGDRLELVVHNAIASPAGAVGDVATPGLGLVGLAERAALAGGALTAGEDAGQFTVRAWLPWAT
ncbi:Signal transduction histidine kinase [Sanguibacter gelidistatuariae]|uniref:histidine kinase n=2 Tax=Sanguibacter gelidistatuariae TaxID=1814289 RepID=A0A1G6H656_9MICO|nr:Signal transduction histidine kinase [Sanguibacter gelidistatuariae]